MRTALPKSLLPSPLLWAMKRTRASSLFPSSLFPVSLQLQEKPRPVGLHLSRPRPLDIPPMQSPDIPSSPFLFLSLFKRNRALFVGRFCPPAPLALLPPFQSDFVAVRISLRLFFSRVPYRLSDTSPSPPPPALKSPNTCCLQDAHSARGSEKSSELSGYFSSGPFFSGIGSLPLKTPSFNSWSLQGTVQRLEKSFETRGWRVYVSSSLSKLILRILVPLAPLPLSPCCLRPVR